MRWPWDVRQEVAELRTFRAEISAVMDQNLLLLTRLEERVAQLRADWVYERERADRAVDSLLASKGMAPVMPDPQPSGLDSPELFREDPKDVDKILKEMGLARGSA